MEIRKIDIPFSKYVSSGNDFIIIENFNINARLVRKMCKEKWGIYSDGVLLLKKENENYRVSIYNADGSQAKMCGNGLKCMVQYLKNKEPTQCEWDVIVDKRTYHLKWKKSGVTIQIPFPQMIKEKDNAFVYNIGNLHRIFLHPLNDEKQRAIAKMYPNENISFYQIKKEGVIYLRTYERGVGFTYSCGSASLVVAFHYLKKHTKRKKVHIETKGGRYVIEKKENYLLLKGKAQCVFLGRYFYEISR